MSKHTIHSKRILWVLVLFITVGQLTAGIYLPSMPFFTHYFHSNSSHAQLTLTAYLLSYGVSQIFYGPLSDRFGRRRISLITLVLFIAASVLAFCAPTIDWLIAACFIQGLGIGSVGVMARTVIRDLYSGKKLHGAASIISIAIVLGPIAAPILGGYLQHYLNWQANFIFLTIFGIITFIIMWFYFSETNRFAGQSKLHIRHVIMNYKQILFHRTFLGHVINISLCFGGITAYEVASPFLYQSRLHLTPQTYGWVMAIPLVGYILGSVLSGRMIHYISSHKIMVIGLISLAVGGLAMLLTGLSSYLTVAVIAVPMTVYLFGSGFVFPVATSGVIEPFPLLAGTAGALSGTLQNIIASGTSGIIVKLHEQTQTPLAIMLVCIAVLCTCAFVFLIRPAELRQRLQEQHEG